MVKLKTPPHNDEAERSVLGGILIDKDAINVVSELLLPHHFYNDMHSMIYEAMLRLYEERKPIDLLTLTAQFKKNKTNTKIESTYLTELVESVPTAANIATYAHLVKEAFTKRSLIQAGTRIAEMGYEEDVEVKEVLDKAESSLFSISQGHITRGFVPVKQTLAESFDRIDELHRKGEGGLRGVATGFVDLDSMLSGMQNANLLILAARPGQGKTAMVLNIAQHIAVNEKKSVGIFSLEMSKEELVDRLIVAQADVDAWRFKTGKLTDPDYVKLSDAMGELGDAPLFIDDTPGLSLAEMRSKARRLQLEHKVGLFIVDYLQLVDPGRRYDNRVQEVSIVSQALKNLARELNIPVLSASQLSRAVEHRGEKKPQLADLRESGAIEQDADVVMFLYRPDNDVSGTLIPTNLLIAKHRNGRTGEIPLLFRGDRIRFLNVEKHKAV
ncbi:MAG: replicative DNA helicase [Candidatus Levybacteria bacterium]|nr:replicative DNA helicase [Candidatus Levybacteria bacterium]